MSHLWILYAAFHNTYVVYSYIDILFSSEGDAQYKIVFEIMMILKLEVPI